LVNIRGVVLRGNLDIDRVKLPVTDGVHGQYMVLRSVLWD
jgi:hypothetical protein